MSSKPDEIRSRFVNTARLRCHIRECGDPGGVVIIFIHGNFSSANYFDDFMLSMPDKYHCIAVDLRGYGQTEDLLVDARRGARDWSDDIYALMQTLAISRAHFLGWSAGAAALMQLAVCHSPAVASMTLLAPVSPFGFGGTKDIAGAACYSDFAGSGGGIVSTEFVARIAAGDNSDDSPLSPRNVLRTSFVRPPFRFLREDDLLAASLSQKTGANRYPGDSVDSVNWPFVRPGCWGPLNAVSAQYLNLQSLVEVAQKPPILWLRGDCDEVISDRSLSDPAVLGEMGLIPDWPGPELYPAQPMVGQTRYVLEAYEANGGNFKEVVISGVGHTPFLESSRTVSDHFCHFMDGI